MARPENSAVPPELHYKSSKKYALSSRLNYIQKQITRKCLSFLCLQKNSLILDIGCGTGISGREIAKNGYEWIGCDISIDMLNELVSNYKSGDESTAENEFEQSNAEDECEQNNVEGECDEDFAQDSCSEADNNESNTDKTLTNPSGILNLDISDGLLFKAGTFDGLVSVSCLQWIFHGKSLQESKNAVRRLFTSVKSILKIKSKAVFQFYNVHKDHTKILSEEAQKCGFFSEIIFDGAGRNRKSYLVLDYKSKEKRKEHKRVDKVKEEIERRKQRRIKKGLPVARDSKYSGRKRSKKF